MNQFMPLQTGVPAGFVRAHVASQRFRAGVDCFVK